MKISYIVPDLYSLGGIQEFAKSIAQQAKGFEVFHDYNHRYSTLEGKTFMEKRFGNIKYLPKVHIIKWFQT